MLNNAELVFEKLAGNIYVMSKNRFGQTTNEVYTKEQIDQFREKYTVQILIKAFF